MPGSKARFLNFSINDTLFWNLLWRGDGSCSVHSRMLSNIPGHHP